MKIIIIMGLRSISASKDVIGDPSRLGTNNSELLEPRREEKCCITFSHTVGSSGGDGSHLKGTEHILHLLAYVYNMGVLVPERDGEVSSPDSVGTPLN